MVASLVQAKGQIAANNLAATMPITVSPVTALAALIGGMFNGAAGASRTFTSTSSTWTVDYDDTTKRSVSSAIPAFTGTTTVNANNGATNSDFTAFVAEFLGLKTAGAKQQTVRKNDTGSVTNTPWTTNGLVLTQDSLVICVSVMTSNSTARSTVTGSGFAALAGTGIQANGNIPNGNEGDVMNVSWGNFASGATVTGGGTWDAVVTTDSWLVAYELAPAGGVSDAAILMA